MRIKVLAPQGLRADELFEVQQQGTIATAHVAQSLRLFFQSAVKLLADHLIKVSEIGTVCPSTAPNIEFAVHVDLRLTGLGPPQDTTVPEEQFLSPQESADIRSRDPVCRRTGKEESSLLRSDQVELFQYVHGRLGS